MDISRAIQQLLRDYQRAGLDGLPIDPEDLKSALSPSQTETAPAANPTPPPTSKQPRRNNVAREKTSAPVAPSSPRPTSDPVENSHAPAATATTEPAPRALPSSAEVTPNVSPNQQTIAERESALGELRASVAACTRCAELCESRTQTVFGVGNPNAEILFVGEAPGADEDRQGEPFVGKAGQLLNKIIGACKLTREEIYICNILRCRPPGNRNPSSKEAANCREFLDGQIRIVDPDYIVCWGSVAAQNLLGVPTSIGRMRGRFYEYGRAKVLCTYHPSYLLRNESAKKQVWADMKILMADRGITL